MPGWRFDPHRAYQRNQVTAGSGFRVSPAEGDRLPSRHDHGPRVVAPSCARTGRSGFRPAPFVRSASLFYGSAGQVASPP